MSKNRKGLIQMIRMDMSTGQKRVDDQKAKLTTTNPNPVLI